MPLISKIETIKKYTLEFLATKSLMVYIGLLIFCLRYIKFAFHLKEMTDPGMSTNLFLFLIVNNKLFYLGIKPIIDNYNLLCRFHIIDRYLWIFSYNFVSHRLL